MLPKGKIALGKLIQAIAAGAKVLAVDGNFDEALPGRARDGRAEATIRSRS